MQHWQKTPLLFSRMCPLLAAAVVVVAAVMMIGVVEVGVPSSMDGCRQSKHATSSLCIGPNSARYSAHCPMRLPISRRCCKVVSLLAPPLLFSMVSAFAVTCRRKDTNSCKGDICVLSIVS